MNVQFYLYKRCKGLYNALFPILGHYLFVLGFIFRLLVKVLGWVTVRWFHPFIFLLKQARYSVNRKITDYVLNVQYSAFSCR